METKTLLYGGLPAILKADNWIVISPYVGEIVRIPNGKENDPDILRELEGKEFFSLVDPLSETTDVFHMTLITTSDCNLKCRYCFANSGEANCEMSEEIAFAAVRRGASNARGRIFSIAFFGGEPSLVPKLTESVVEYARTLTLDSDIKGLQFSIISNGVMSEKFADFLIKNDFLITLSADGVPEIQNSQRPLKNGGASAPLLEKTIRYFVKNRKDFGIRATVTDNSVSYMVPMVEWLHSLGGKQIHFESLSIAGRAMRTKGGPMVRPTVEAFAENLKLAIAKGAELDVEITNSSFMNLLSPPTEFCDGHVKDRFAVSYTGDITTCVEVQEKCHPVSQSFIVGSYNKDLKDFVITKQKRERACATQLLTITQKNECENCFAKNICGGGCPVRNYHMTGDSAQVDPYRCRLIKEMLVHVISLFDEAAYGS